MDQWNIIEGSEIDTHIESAKVIEKNNFNQQC